MDPIFVLDRSPRGLLELTGSDRVSFLQGMVSNDVAGLVPGTHRHAALLDSTGHILADLHVHGRDESLLVETDPATLDTLHTTLEKFLIMEDVQIVDVSGQWAIVSVLGQEASTLLSQTPDLPGEASLTSFPIAPGVDLWLPASEKVAVWEVLLAAGASALSAEDADALRIEGGIPKWSYELNPSVLLPEAEMPDAVSYTKGCYVGQEIVARLHARGHTNKALRQILLAEDAPVPPIGTTIHVPEAGPEPGREIGRITSAAASPSRGGQAVGLAYVRKEYFDAGTAVSVQIEQPNGLVFSYAGVVL
ncbi:MAG: YgfZ/GcvT domain-containing protein [Janthinobacterium lividum]